jgi:hypothetical protein
MPSARQFLRITFAAYFLVALGRGGPSGVCAPATLSRGAVAPSQEDRQTARAALDKVMTKAKEWHADAVLIGVFATVDAEGFSDNGAPGSDPSRVVGTYPFLITSIFHQPAKFHVHVVAHWAGC